MSPFGSIPAGLFYLCNKPIGNSERGRSRSRERMMTFFPNLRIFSVDTREAHRVIPITYALFAPIASTGAIIALRFVIDPLALLRISKQFSEVKQRGANKWGNNEH